MSTAALARYSQLAALYSQIQSPVGRLGLLSLQVATRGITGSDALDHLTDASLQAILQRRDAIAGQMLHALDATAFSGDPLSDSASDQLSASAQRLLRCLAAEAADPSRVC